jgi:esterase/lipase
MQTLSFSAGRHGYEFRRQNSKKLLIIIEGSDWCSVLGRVKNGRWIYTGMTAQIRQALSEQYTIFVPEKFNWRIGVDYFNNMTERECYTADNLLKCYTNIINEYLKSHNFDSIAIMGVSEGAILLPLLYNNIVNTKVSSLISLFGGGLSIHEDMVLLENLHSTPNSWKRFYKKILTTYQSKPYSVSIKEGYLGMPLKFWSSIIDILPFEYYKHINIPVLFIQGKRDYRIPKESTEYIQTNLPGKPFIYH